MRTKSRDNESFTLLEYYKYASEHPRQVKKYAIVEMISLRCRGLPNEYRKRTKSLCKFLAKADRCIRLAENLLSYVFGDQKTLEIISRHTSVGLRSKPWAATSKLKRDIKELSLDKLGLRLLVGELSNKELFRGTAYADDGCPFAENPHLFLSEVIKKQQKRIASLRRIGFQHVTVDTPFANLPCITQSAKELFNFFIITELAKNGGHYSHELMRLDREAIAWAAKIICIFWHIPKRIGKKQIGDRIFKKNDLAREKARQKEYERLQSNNPSPLSSHLLTPTTN